MSEQHYIKGKFRRIDFDETSIETYAKNYMICHGFTDLPNCYDDWVDYLKSIYYEEFFIIGGQLYQITQQEEVGDYHTEIHKISDNEFVFYSSFYDGGTCLQECLEEAIESQDII